MTNFGMYVETTHENGKWAWWVTEHRDGKIRKTLCYSEAVWRLWAVLKDVVDENIRGDIKTPGGQDNDEGEAISGESINEMEPELDLYEGA